MDEVRQSLMEMLATVRSRLRQLDGTTAAEELPGERFADEVDEIQASESRDIGFATRALLVDRADRLAAALDRLDHGEYGDCAECGRPISVGRLRAMPEVLTCIACQDRLERLDRSREAGTFLTSEPAVRPRETEAERPRARWPAPERPAPPARSRRARA